jgi:hypothetical protein
MRAASSGALASTGEVDLEFWIGQIRLQQCRLRIQNHERRVEHACRRRSVTKIDARRRSIPPWRDDGRAVFGEDHGPRNPLPNVLGIGPAA